MKKILGVYSAPQPHWVGNGFPVRSLFSYESHGKQLSPFLLLDYAGPARFPPATKPRGVGEHPHRGFETVTIVYQGEVAHRDSTGEGGVIGPGDVQWMTAGAGILHEEFHSPAFTYQGGHLEMIQLWVNLPAADKMAPPSYQAITGEQIPVVPLAAANGEIRVIAGEFQGHAGPAKTFSPMLVWDVTLQDHANVLLDVPDGWNTAVIARSGSSLINEHARAAVGQMVVLSSQGNQVQIQTEAESQLLLIAGEPLNEPIEGYGPFVMNTKEEIRQAIRDFQQGDFGKMSS
ncbi:MAG: pirin family protein [Alcanivorax jadensis]|jgi:redox-sensitive bicupin YhaK (pirin superfamily)|uniref:pirin family protein n=1 Tax=Alcanivorax TaxID=59753 RepID=UPI002356515B|nr:pirin family protein [Alcanivorax jadensis]MDF1638849.1 pirin family protein [Alcanivorax jadensis]|tara:strand:- start:34517 stop:35383 length:867 start_codon:yes stop_codon:yes gene_type:complete